MDQWTEQLMNALRNGRAEDIDGTRVAADLSLSDRVLNQAIAANIRPGGPVRDVVIRTEPGRAKVTVKLTRPSFLPPVSVTLTVDAQPELPASPVLVLRLGMAPGVAALLGAGVNLMTVLPPGVRLDGDRVFIDLAAALEERGHAYLLQYARSLKVSFEDARTMVHIYADTKP